MDPLQWRVEGSNSHGLGYFEGSYTPFGSCMLSITIRILSVNSCVAVMVAVCSGGWRMSSAKGSGMSHSPGGVVCSPFSSNRSSPGIIAVMTGAAFRRTINHARPIFLLLISFCWSAEKTRVDPIKSDSDGYMKVAFVMFAQIGSISSGLKPIILIIGSPKHCRICVNSSVENVTASPPNLYALRSSPFSTTRAVSSAK